MTEEDNSSENNDVNETESKEILSYRGTLIYYMRYVGLEEGAHAVFYQVKTNGESENAITQVEEAKKSIIEVDSETQGNYDGAKATSLDKPLRDVTREDLRILFNGETNDIGEFEGDVEQALDYCESFISGALVPINRVVGEKSKTKFALVKPAPNKPIHNFTYSDDYDTVYINWDTLNVLTQPPYSPDAIITTSTNRQDYIDQPHEKRAVIWQIKDAREHGLDELADMLSAKLKG